MDKTNPRYIEVREEIAEFYYNIAVYYFLLAFDDFEDIPAELLDKQWETELNYADILLDIVEGLAILDKDHNLPIIPECAFDSYAKEETVNKCYLTINKMLNAGFKKVLK